MLMRRLILIISIFSLNSLWAQSVRDVDTLRFGDRTAGELDSVDIAKIFPPGTTDGGRFYLRSALLQPDRLISNHFVNRELLNDHSENIRFSALPRIGFMYSFGGQGTQYFHSNYTHSFNDHLTLNLDYNRYSTNNYLRNSGLEYHNLSLKINGYWNKYMFMLRSSYSLNKSNYSGGIISDSLLETFGLEFMQVNKSDSRSRMEQFNTKLDHYINLGDSLNRYGVVINNHFSILNRKYWENDSIFGLYDSYIDSFQTYDQYNLPEIGSAAGFFFWMSKLYADLTVDATYWEYQNQGKYTDTIEYDMNSGFAVSLGSLNIRNQFNYNLIGNFNEWAERLDATYIINAKNQLEASVSLSEMAPKVQQRYYRSNNFNYHLNTIEKTNITTASLHYRSSIGDSLLSYHVGLFTTRIVDPYQWSGDQWQMISGKDLFFTGGHLRLNLIWKSLHFNNEVIYQYSENKELPEWMYSGRLYLKEKLFKAKKMELLIGAEPQFFSSFISQSFLPAMDVFYWDVNQSELPELFNLHAFAGFEIDEFRFYLRMEELGWLWNISRRQDVNNYPLAELRFRVGVVWDFFN